jgi:membrane protein DedA with SNARE-associated domain
MLPPRRLQSVQASMRRWGPGYLFLVRFLPGMRSALLFAAGSMKIPYRQLLLFDGAAGLIELPLLVYAVRLVGGRWQDILAAVQRWQSVLLPVLLLLAIAGCLLAWLRRRRRSEAD